MKLQIKTLSPIHIGNGEKYNGLGYLVNRGIVSFYDSTKVMENITPRYSERFMQWIEQRTTEIERLDTQKRNERDEQRRRGINQQLRDAQRRLSLREFLENEIRDASIKNRFNQKFLYTIEAKSQVYNNVDIECFIKQNNKPYIPGTEIKGAIRTAVLYTLLNKDSNLWINNPDRKKIAEDKLDELINNIKDFGSKHAVNITKVKDKRLERWMKEEKRIKEKILVKQMKEIQGNLQEKLLRVINNNDAKYDLLKLLYIGDTETKTPNSCLFVSNLKVTGINRGFSIFQEFLKEDQIFTCQGFKLGNDNKMTTNLILDKLGFSPEQKWIISDIKNLFQCCYEFTGRLLREEIDYFNHLNELQIVTKLQDIQRQNTPDSPVIRLGKNEGYFSLTMGLLVKDKDKTLYDNVLCHATKNTSYTGNFPKTRRVVNLSNNEQDTLGWVKLILEE